MTAQRDNTAYGHGPLQRIARQQPHVKLLLGNWRNASLLSLAPSYDVVLVDYLLAAVNMHWPYHEEAVLERVLGTCPLLGAVTSAHLSTPDGDARHLAVAVGLDNRAELLQHLERLLCRHTARAHEGRREKSSSEVQFVARQPAKAGGGGCK